MTVYHGGGGGKFVSFKNIGDTYAGVVSGVRDIPNNMQVGTFQTVVDLTTDSGEKIVVALGPRALQSAWKQAETGEGKLIGRYVTFRFVSQYKPKNGGNLGKDISVDVRPVAAPPSGDAYEAAYAALVTARGAEAAAQIKKSVEMVAKGDVAGQIKMLVAAATSQAA
jgi:hypothetical protein